MSNDVATIDDEEPAKPLSREVDAFLRATNIVDAINANLPLGSKPLAHIPKEVALRQIHRGVVNDAFNTVFYMRGGAPGLAAWADKEPTSFYQTWAKLAQSEAAGAQQAVNVTVISAVPHSPLDTVAIHPHGGVVDAEIDDIDGAIG